MNNYHTHTYRCQHAIGNERELVEKAVSEGYSELGFSDHVPLPNFRKHLLRALPYTLSSIHDILSWLKSFIRNGPGMRMPYKEKKKHEKEVTILKKEFASQIKIYQGYECEYFKDYLPYYQSLIDSKQVDYLIFGHHFHQYSISSSYYGKSIISDKEIVNYVDEAIEALNTGLFKYFAHPDLIFIGYHEWNDFLENQITRLLKVVKEKDILLEINAGGYIREPVLFKGELVYPYPNKQFWQFANKMKCKVILGLDVHSPEELNKQRYLQLEKFCRELNIIPVKKLGIERS